MEELKKASADLNQKTEALKSGKEPVSGEQGKGTASDPFDQGNSEGGSPSPPLELRHTMLRDRKPYLNADILVCRR